MYRGGWWSWGHNEPELRSLIEWIDRKAQYYGDSRGGVLGALMGTAGGLMGGTIGVLAGGLNLDPGLHPWVVIGPLLAFMGISAGSLFWYFKGRTRDQKAAARAFAESRGLYQKLLIARYQGTIKNLLGQEGAVTLNNGAYQWLRCRNALEGAAWQSVSSESVYAEARQKITTAMDIGMARLVLLIGSGTPANDPQVGQILEMMKANAEEASKTGGQLSAGSADTGATDELRNALEHIRQINQAQDEIDRESQQLRG